MDGFETEQKHGRTNNFNMKVQIHCLRLMQVAQPACLH
jgi:hypothetical protein